MPHKIWAVGEEALAADFNSYVQNQVVPQFPNTAARDTWAGPPKGALCVTTDTNTVWQYSGAAWTVFPSTTMPRGRIYRTTNNAYGDGTAKAQIMDAVRTDVGGTWNVAQPTRLTLPVAGWYAVGAGATWGPNTSGYRQISIRRNGTQVVAMASQLNISSFNVDQSITTMYQFSAGDYVELWGFQNAGASVSMLALPNYSPELWATWLAP